MLFQHRPGEDYSEWVETFMADPRFIVRETCEVSEFRAATCYHDFCGVVLILDRGDMALGEGLTNLDSESIESLLTMESFAVAPEPALSVFASEFSTLPIFRVNPAAASPRALLNIIARIPVPSSL